MRELEALESRPHSHCFSYEFLRDRSAGLGNFLSNCSISAIDVTA